jgi:hypothetical protein
VQVKVVPAIDPMLTTPLTIEAKAENGATVSLKKITTSLVLEKTIKYKKSTDTSWKDYEFADGLNGAEISLNQGESVSFWSNNAALAQKPGFFTLYTYLVISDECYVYGNVMSMIDDQEGATAENPKFSTDEEIGGSFALSYLFKDCQKILNHESKELVLPAKKLASSCYSDMFVGCKSLEKAPEIAAETVAPWCCQYMFYNCTSLREGPVLKAKTLEEYCYNGMFRSCYKLGSLTCLATDISATGCISAWLGFAGAQVEGDKILYVDPSMTEANWKFPNGYGWKTVSAVD